MTTAIGRWSRRVRCLHGLALAVLFCGFSAAAAPYRIAMVLPRPVRDTEAAFQNYLRNRGVQADYTILHYSGKPEDAAALVTQLQELKPDLIYTWGGPTTLAIAGPIATARPRDYIRQTPIVFAEVADAVTSKLLDDLARPGRNLTGVSHVAPLAAQMQAMRSYAAVRKLGYIANPQDPLSHGVRAELGRMGRQMGFELVDEVVPFDAGGRADVRLLRQAISRIAAQGADFLYIGPGALLSFTLREVVTTAALEAKLPTFCATENASDSPPRCLFGLRAGGPNAGRLAAHKAAQILLERQPIASIPVESLDRFSLFINVPVALTLQMYPPLELLDVAELIGVPAAGRAADRKIPSQAAEGR